MTDSNGRPARLAIPGLMECRDCALRSGCSRVVAGFGVYPNKVMIVAQSPGKEEDFRGIPLIGKSGTFLEGILRGIGWELDSLYRTNINKCQPPMNRKTTPVEKRACRKWLDMEVSLVDPDLIICLGDDAYRAFIPEEGRDKYKSITEVRGNFYQREIRGRQRWVMPTVHPAYVLRNRDGLAPGFRNDLRKAKDFIEGNLNAQVLPFRKQEATWPEIMEATEADMWAVDFETAPDDAWIIGIGVCATEGNGLYYPFEDEAHAASYLRDMLKPRFENKALKIASQVNYELHRLREYGIQLNNYGDTLIRSWLLGDQRLGLKTAIHNTFGLEMIRIDKFKEAGYKYKSARTGEWGPDMLAAQRAVRHQVVEYAAQDPDATLRLHIYQDVFLDERPALRRMYHDLELPFAEIILAMENNGIGFDPTSPALLDADRELTAGYASVLEYIYELTGWRNINPISSQQVARLIYPIEDGYDHLYKLPEESLDDWNPAKNDYPPTDKITLGRYIDNPVVRAILTARAIKKMHGTYIQTLPTHVQIDGRIHCRIQQTGTGTGRVSTADPSLQQIPSREREDVDTGVPGGQMRQAFVPLAPFDFLACPDLSQIEMRIAAHLSGDKKMCELITSGADLHAYSAEGIYRKTEADVSPDEWKNMRYLAKTIGFGTLYGLQPEGLVLRTPTLNLSLEDAARFINSFYDTYPGLRTWQLELVESCRDLGYVETILGRRRYFPNIRANDRTLREADERAAMNAPIQGSAADYFKLCLLAVDEKIRTLGLRSRLVMQVHDEIIIESMADEIDIMGREAIPLMLDRFPLRVPVKTDYEFGPSWGEMHAWPHIPSKCKTCKKHPLAFESETVSA